MNGIARTKLANILIRAGFNKSKCLRAVNYPYFLAVVLDHTGIEISYKYIQSSTFGFYRASRNTYLNDFEYNIKPNQTKIKCFASNNDPNKSAFSSKVKVKYKYQYPRGSNFEKDDEFGSDRTFALGVVGSQLGVQRSVFPLADGWGIPEAN